MELLIAHFWYVLAGFLGFFVWRKKKKKIPFSSDTMVIGHMGASGYALENSLPSFSKAVELKVDFIETDVRRAYDGVFILAHDDRVKGRRNRKFRISQKPHSFLKTLSLPGNNKLVTLSEFAESFSSQRILFDLKIGGSEFEFLSFLRRYDLVDKCLVSSSLGSSLRLLKVLEPRLVVGLSFPRNRFGFWKTVLLAPILTPFLIIFKHTYPFYLGILCSWAKADFIAVYYRFLTGRLVKAAHKRGLLVFPFAVNQRRNILKMLRLGVDGIISDYPDRVRLAIKNL